MTAIWTRPVPATVEGPLAVDTVSIFVATRDGALRALDAETGRPRWRADNRPGVVAAGGGLVAQRGEDGTVWTMDGGTGSDRWKAASGVRGSLPAVLYKDVVVVAGEGRAGRGGGPGPYGWKGASGVRGSLPAVLYKDVVVVAGEGLAVLEVATGQPRWTAPE